MFLLSCRPFRRLDLLIGVWAVIAAFTSPGPATLQAQDRARDVAAAVVPRDRVLTSFEQIWLLSEVEQRDWYRVKLDYVVYFYDPLWMALWGRCGESDSYVSLGTKVFPIKAGQRILIEGLLQPSRGMRIDDPKVTVLAESVEVEVLSTAGQVGRPEQFNKRLVTIDGYVDRQVARDANHLEIYMVAEGRSVLAQLVVNNDMPIPQLKGALVRAKGVYFARSEQNWIGPKIELWVQRNEDIEVLGTIERDGRFDLPVTPLEQLAQAPPEKLVHVVGRVHDQQPGSAVTLRDERGEVILSSPQTLPVKVGEQIEAIGYPAEEAGAWTLRHVLFRPTQKVLTSVAEVWGLPESELHTWHRLRVEMLVYFFDPTWRVLWGRSANSYDYLSLGANPVAVKSGQRVLIEGSVLPVNNGTVEEPRITILEDAVPLDPVDTRGRIGDVELFQKRWVTVEGLVDRQLRSDATHAELDLLVEGRVMVARLLIEEETEFPNWEDARLRLTGVYSATHDPTGALPSLELWVPGLRNIEVVGSLANDERFAIPLTRIEELSSAARDALVRVIGNVRTQQPGNQVTIRDESGQVSLLTTQTRPVQMGDTVEAIGYPVVEGTRITLRDAVYRRSQAALPVVTVGLPKLRLADQLRELQPEEAARSYPVQLSGVVTWARPNADFFFLLDASGGVCVYPPPGFNLPLYAGTKVDVTGVSATGRFTPVVLASSVQAFSTIDLPEPRLVTLEQALTGVEEAQWVNMSGYVRAVVQEGPWSRLELTTTAGEFRAMLGAPHERWLKLVGSVVRVRGVCSAITNEKRQLTGIQVWVPLSRYLEVEDPVPSDAFAFPTRSIASLRQFSSMQALNRRVRVSGVVIHHAPGRVVHIQDETEGLMVLSRDTAPLALGDRIEAVGFPGRENSRVVLREAVYRRIEAAAQPAPLELRSLSPIDAERDGRLVRAHGRLLDLGTHESGVRLIVESGEMIFDALLDMERMAVPEHWVPQSEVALTGVYVIQFDEYRRPHSVRMHLRTPGDVAVLARPPWWTVRRALAVTAALAVVVLLGFGWVIALRRRVHRQRGLILEQVESERAARLEAALARASKLESLGVLAGGIAHDFNNLLTVIIGNLSLAKLDGRIEPDTVRCLTESERAAARARDLTQQLLTFAKGGEPMRTPTRLLDLVREAAQFALHGSKVSCDYDVVPDLWPASVDRGQIGQVVHNIVLNASQAMPEGGSIRISLGNEQIAAARAHLNPGRYVRLTFADNGAGIPPDNLARIFEPYFSTKPQGTGLGLATVYSIIRKHDGHIEVASKLGEGTRFSIWLPAAPTPPGASVEVVAQPKPAASVLLMDDEASIRLLGSAVLKRIGCQVTAVTDGAAAVSEYAAASAAGRPYDLVILDLTVPGGMGGAEAMTKLTAMNPEIRAIVSSGYSSDPVMANFGAHGFAARVPKPYQASDLIEAVQRVLGPRVE